MVSSLVALLKEDEAAWACRLNSSPARRTEKRCMELPEPVDGDGRNHLIAVRPGPEEGASVRGIQLRTGPLQQFGQPQRHPDGFLGGDPRPFRTQPGMDAPQDLGLGWCLYVVQRLRLLHQVVGQIFTQFVALAHHLGAFAQASLGIAVHGDEGGRDENLVVVMHTAGRQSGVNRRSKRSWSCGSSNVTSCPIFWSARRQAANRVALPARS